MAIGGYGNAVKAMPGAKVSPYDPYARFTAPIVKAPGGVGPAAPPKMTADETIHSIIKQAQAKKQQLASTPPPRNGAVAPVWQTTVGGDPGVQYMDATTHGIQTLQAMNSGADMHAAGTNGGGAVGGGAAAAQSGAPQTGYAAGYRPAFNATVAYDNPEILARDVLASMGINDPVLAAQLASNGDFASLAAFLSGGGTSDADFINSMGNYFKGQSTVGGATPDTAALLGAILGAGKDPNGAIAQYLGIGSSVADPNALANATRVTNATIQNALNDQNPYTQKAMKNYLANLASQYAGLQAHGAANMPDYATFLKSRGVGGYVR